MTAHERFLACMRFEAVDHPPVWEWAPWGSTLRRWQREALGTDGTPPQYDECENRVQCGADFWMLPRFKEEILSQDQNYVTERTDRGVIRRTPRSADEMTMPEFVGYPVTSAEDWKRLRARFDPADPDRFPTDWADRCERWRSEGPMLILQGPRSPSLFGFVRELMGAEAALTAFYDDPGMVHDMMDCVMELTIAVLRRVAAEAPLTAIYFWEDMAYKGGSLISPALMREFMVPRYRRITDVARSLGIDIIFVDSDGDITELIPLWLEAGLNGVYPLEIAAGMDPAALRRQYGRDLIFTGGIDKRALAAGPAAIDAELEARMPLAEQGGYIPHIDHAIPHDVSYQNFVYYWGKKRKYLGFR